MTATAVSVDVDGTTLTEDTDYLFNPNTGRLKLKTSMAQIAKSLLLDSANNAQRTISTQNKHC